MKVLLIDVNCKNSSTGKIVYDLYTAVNKSGNEAAVCYGRGEKITERNIFKFGLDIETYIHAFLTRVTGYTGCFSPFSTQRLIRFIKKFQPDVIHIHELHAYFVNIAPLLKFIKKRKIKTIITLHCEFMYTGKCGHSIECEKWKTECKNCPHLKDYPSTMLFDHTKTMFKQKKKLFENFENLTIVTPSKWLAERVKQSFLGDKDIQIINNGINTELFSPQDTTTLREKHNILNEEKIILSVAPGIMSEEKGGRYVLELSKKMEKENFRFILIGAEEDTKTDKSNVEILGRIYDRKLLATYYSLADAFVICSKRENFPTTCIEAQCCGVPIFGFDTGGTKETSVSKWGSFVPYTDIDMLADAIREAVEKITIEEKNTIRKNAIKYFSVDRMCTGYINLYEITGKCRIFRDGKRRR